MNLLSENISTLNPNDIEAQVIRLVSKMSIDSDEQIFLEIASTVRLIA
jgi:hypothetical protein